MFSSNFTMLFTAATAQIYKTVTCDTYRPLVPDQLVSVNFREETVFCSLGIGISVFVDTLKSRSHWTSTYWPSTCHKTKTRTLVFDRHPVVKFVFPRAKAGTKHQWLRTNNRIPSIPNPTLSHSPTPNFRLIHSTIPPGCVAHVTTVNWGDRGVACEQCGQWFLGNCQSIDIVYFTLWERAPTLLGYCAACGSPNSKTIFDLHGVDWIDSAQEWSPNSSSSIPNDLQFRPSHTSTPTPSNQQNKWKDRPLWVMHINFQSASLQRAEMPNLLESLEPDIIRGTKMWQDTQIADSESLPAFYKVYRAETDNGEEC